MSDFDDVLERLLLDQSFRAALGADPAAALVGYQLSPDEIELLRAQVSGDEGGSRPVEARTSKASVFGLLSELGNLAGSAASGGIGAGHGGIGAGNTGAGAEAGAGAGHAGFTTASREGFTTASREGFGPVSHQGFEPVSHEGFGPVSHEGFGPVSREGLGPVSHQGFGPVDQPGVGMGTGEGPAPLQGGGDHTPVGYHPHIDADGDGKWDQYVAVQHQDGSVDIYADRNHDGVIDFDGHDRDADGVVDSADYDENFDGVADTHMTDVNGDGWLDTRRTIPPPAS